MKEIFPMYGRKSRHAFNLVLAVGSLALAVAGAVKCSAQTVVNGSFETGDAPPYGGSYIPAPNSTAISGWTVQAGSVDYIGNDTWPAADGSRSLDMSGHDAGALTQHISGFTPGHEYRLSFYMAANNDGVARIFRLQAKIGAVTETFSFDATGRTYADMGWSLRTLDFTATNTTLTLTFTSLETGNAGPALDNVSISPVSGPCVSAPSGLVSWWRAENNASDQVRGNNGMLVGNVSFVPGKVGLGFGLNGSDSFVQIPHHASLNLTNEFTLELWYLEQGKTWWYAMMTKRNGGYAPANFGIHVGPPGFSQGLQLWFTDPTVGGDSTSDYLPVPPSGIFHHLAATFRQADSTHVELKTFVDGQLVKTTMALGNLANTLNTAPILIGADYAAQDIFKGIIDEVSIYNRALSLPEVQSIYNAGSAGKCVSTPTPVTLLNVNFAADPNKVKTGFAAVGQTTNDFWNAHWFPNQASTSLSALKLADSTVTAVGLTVQNAPGVWGNGHPDHMYDTYVYPWSLGTSITVTVTNLPPNRYDIYLYGHGPSNDGNTVFKIEVGGRNCGTNATTLTSNWSSTVWQEGVQYVVFRGVAVSNLAEIVTVTAMPGVSRYTPLAGMQIVASPAPPPVCAPAPLGLVSLWRAEDNADDAVAGNNGALMNGATYAAGTVGQGFSLNGASQFVQVPNSASLNLTNAITLEFWYKQSVAGNYAFIAKRYPGYNLGPCNFGFNVNSGTMFLYFRDPAYPANFRGVEYPAPSVGVFHHLAGTYRQVDASNLELSIYIDGQLAKTALVAGNLARCVNDTPVTIGADNATGFYLNGVIDDVAIYSRALAAGEIQTIYAAGSAGKCVPAPPPNHPPIADASATQPQIIVSPGCQPTVVLDGSRSTDPDADPLQYRWFKTGETNAFATGVVAVVSLPLGAHSVTLIVDDSLATDAHTFTVELITPAQAVERLIALVNSQAQKPHPLIATLSAALASIERGNYTAAINQLAAFQNKVRAQVAPDNAALAAQFIQTAQAIIDALSRDCAAAKPHGKIGKVHHHGNGKVRMEFSAPDGWIHLVEASTNLVVWEKIGVAIQSGPGEFEFEDPGDVRLPTRFYRIVDE